MSDWLWHVFHDPMRSNPWSLLALALIVGGIVALMWVTAGRRR